MRILVLGHKGMLGHMVCMYLESLELMVETIVEKWPSNEFKNNVKNSKADFLINCIAAIPQKKDKNYFELNIKLPIWLAKNFNGKMINPATDGEFSGKIPINQLYLKNNFRDADDDYGLSKACVGFILKNYDNVKQIRTSINGPELGNGGTTLFSWFKSQSDEVKCINNHYWSGITTLEWSKNALLIMKNWKKYPKIVQLSTKCITKLQLLDTINRIFSFEKKIIPISDITTINRCLKSDFELPTLEQQFIELKKFYYGI
jgi:dTDP-4-dehydrorhamnose reductase